MKFLIGIPCLYNVDATEKCIESVVHKNVDVILLDNGAEQSVKNTIARYAGFENVSICINEENVYVNPAWNYFLGRFFADNSYTHLILLNSDLVLQNDWFDVLKARLRKDQHEITLPVISDTLPDKVDTEYSEGQTVNSGTPGVFICLSRVCAQLIYPIPKEIRVWFGDNWIFDGLRGMEFKTTIAHNLLAYHYHGGSQSVQRTPEISSIIEVDKHQWTHVVEPQMQQKIKAFNTNV